MYSCLGDIENHGPSAYVSAGELEVHVYITCLQVDPSLYAGVLPLYPAGYDPLMCNIEHSGKLTVLSKMLEYLHSNTREKIVLVSNYTQVCAACECADVVYTVWYRIMDACLLVLSHYRL